MSSSLPVPSKAALTALRGLVLGTSCTLALIAEDRRRKINNAVRVVENGQKIKSAKRYRAGGTALAVAMEEEALWDPGFGLALHQHSNNSEPATPALLFTGERRNQGMQLGRQHGVVKMTEAPAVGWMRAEAEVEAEDDVAPEQTIVHNTDSTNSPPPPSQSARRVKPPKRAPVQLPPKLTTPPTSGPSWMHTTVNAKALKAYAFPTNDEIVAQVRRACDTKDHRQIAAALRAVLEAMHHKAAPDNLDGPWIESTALLCRTCQEQGLLDDAAKLLYRVINWGPMEESAYVSHEPFALIDSLLARTELSEQTRDAYVANVDTAVNLFVPKFTDRPTGVNLQVYSLGRKLLEVCFSANRLHRIFGVHRRCNLVAGADSNDLTGWFLTKLHEKQDYTSVVKVFCSTFAQSSPTKASVHAIGDMVVDSVELAHNHRPEDVFNTLQSICASLGDTRLNPKWVIKLFVSHWKKHGNFGEIEAMFEQLQSPRLEDTVYRSENIYRVMVELALEAGEAAKADSYFAAAVAQEGALASDVRLLGVTARFHAAAGDWDAVRADFEAMNQSGTPSDKAYGQVFVPVLKAYAERHTVRETEAFLKSYVDELKVPLCSFTVTLMAKQYGAARDVDSLIGWLDYCSQADFPVDAAFSNSILVRCRRQWKLPFRDLRTLFRKLQVLNPDFVDKHTEQIMADAALTDSKHGGKAAKGRLLSLRVDVNKAPHHGKHAPVEDVIMAMKEALACKCPLRALRIYKRAFHLNMPYSEQALRLAIRAQLTAAPKNYTEAYELLRKASSRNAESRNPSSRTADITPVTTSLLAHHLSTITSTATTPASAETTIQSALAQYRASGHPLTPAILNRAALACLGAGHFRGAVAYALQAADTSSPAGAAAGGGACFNLPNFRVLLAAYAELLDVEGLRDTVARGVAAPYGQEAACRSALRHARSRVMLSTARPGATREERVAAREVLEGGIGRCVEGRRRLRGEGRRLEEEAVRIMRRAARDMEVDMGAGGSGWAG